jgi:hypothetical protein
MKLFIGLFMLSVEYLKLLLLASMNSSIFAEYFSDGVTQVTPSLLITKFLCLEITIFSLSSSE